ncbi:MAG: GNAT family N-acetyltransferase [Candidatus Thorarchaeota archaeon]
MTDDNLVFRNATIDDLSELVKLWLESAQFHQSLEPRFQYTSDATEATESYMSKQINSEKACYRVAQIDDSIVGYIEVLVTERPPIHVHKRIGYIGSLYVTPDSRRKGIGTKLWLLAYDWLMKKGVQVINLMVASKNPAALEFWKNLNFSEIMVRLEMNSN